MWIMAASCIPSFIGLLTMSLLPNTDEYKWYVYSSFNCFDEELTKAPRTKWGMYLMTVVCRLKAIRHPYFV